MFLQGMKFFFLTAIVILRFDEFGACYMTILSDIWPKQSIFSLFVCSAPARGDKSGPQFQENA